MRDAAEQARNGEQEDKLELLCASNGGVILEPRDGEVVLELVRLIYLFRTRYLLEFPAPDRGTSGVHSLEVLLKDKKNLVRATGASAVLPDAGSMSDPDVIPTQSSPAVFGPRRPLDATKH